MLFPCPLHQRNAQQLSSILKIFVGSFRWLFAMILLLVTMVSLHLYFYFYFLILISGQPHTMSIEEEKILSASKNYEHMFGSVHTSKLEILFHIHTCYNFIHLELEAKLGKKVLFFFHCISYNFFRLLQTSCFNIIWLLVILKLPKYWKKILTATKMLPLLGGINFF